MNGGGEKGGHQTKKIGESKVGGAKKERKKQPKHLQVELKTLSILRGKQRYKSI